MSRRRIRSATLDLCCGSGVQGLLASRWSGQVVGVDLNPRAIRFSVFNALLNGIENIRFLCSDLYTQVDGERFDVILANPPFVPSPVAGCHFRDGGRDGESVLRPIVERSTEFLTPDGLLCAVSDLAAIRSPGHRQGHDLPERLPAEAQDGSVLTWRRLPVPSLPERRLGNSH